MGFAARADLDLSEPPGSPAPLTPTSRNGAEVGDRPSGPDPLVRRVVRRPERGAGRLWAKVGDEESEVGPGSLLIIPSNYVHAFRQLTDEDVVFYECFAPIRLEYLIGFKGPDASLAMMKKALAAE